MTLSIGELVGYVTLDTSGVRRGVASTKAAVRALGTDMGNTLNGTAKVTGGAVGTALKGLTLGLGAAGVAGAAMGIHTAAGLEQAKIAFTTMLGSATKADSFLRQLSAFAAKTPFEFPELQTAASSLISAGINANKVIPIMTTLGDVTSGMGTGAEGVQRATVALQQMNAAGKITGEDLNQLRDAGIPVYDLLAAATGKSKAQVVALAQAGKLGGKALGQMMHALETGKGLERFSGLMEKQSASLTGMWSTFTDTLNMDLAKAITPMIPLLKDGLGGATKALAATLPKLTSGLMAVVRAGIKVTKWLQDHKAVTIAVVAVLGTAMALWAAAATAAAVSNVVAWVTTSLAAVEAGATMELTTAQMAFRWAWMAAKALASAARMAASWLIAMGPVGIVIAIVVALVALIVTHWDTVKRVTARVWSWVSSHIAKVWASIKHGVSAAVGAVKGAVAKAWHWVQSKTSSVWHAIQHVVGAVWSAIKAVVRREVNGVMATIHAIASLPGRMRDWFGRAKDAAVSKLGSLLSWVRGLPGKIVHALSGIGGRMLGIGKNIVSGIVSGIRSMGGYLINSVTSFVKDHIPGPVAKVLGIHSPSRVMADRVGRWIPAGIAQGIHGNLSVVDKAVNAMSDRVLRASAPVTGRAGVPAMAGAGRGQTVVERTHTVIDRRGPLIGHVQQQPGESADNLAERLWFKTRTRG